MRLSRLAFSVTPLVLFAACGTAPGMSSTPTPTGPPPEATAENIAEGGRIFNNTVCQTCHGSRGAGSNRGPALNDKTWLHGDGSYAQIVAIIKDGFSLADILDQTYRQMMPPRGRDPRTAKELTDAEVKQVAAYVWSISHDMPKPPTP